MFFAVCLGAAWLECYDNAWEASGVPGDASSLSHYIQVPVAHVRGHGDLMAQLIGQSAF